MKLISAKFTNFRLLRDLELDFSTDSDKKLTIIRAANESGKTTILNGLQWALYGDDALPGKNGEYRLHPIDWNTRNGKRVSIRAEVQFEKTYYHFIHGKLNLYSRIFELVRSTSEYVGDQGPRTSTLKLFEQTMEGREEVSVPEAVIKEMVPVDQRGIYFLDGDRALSFIEAENSRISANNPVQKAIRSLLGIDLVDSAIKHVNSAKREVNKELKKIGNDSELNEVLTKIEELENTKQTQEEELKDVQEQFSNFEKKIGEVEKKRSEVLIKGNRSDINDQLIRLKDELTQVRNDKLKMNKKHSQLFRNESIALNLLNPMLINVYEMLNELHDKGKIPNTTIPVLQERLDTEKCICGESLKRGRPDDERRRTHIQKVIDHNKKDDEVNKINTELYFRIRQVLEPSNNDDEKNWLTKYKEIVNKRHELEKREKEIAREYKVQQDHLKSLPNVDLEGLNKALQHYQEQRDRFFRKQSNLESDLIHVKKDLRELEDKSKKLIREKVKWSQVSAKSDIIEDVLKLTKKAKNSLEKEKLEMASRLMNNIFLEMIGADTEQRKIIQRAEINSKFDIVVYGPKERKLNSNRDLNGASRRALTLAFILALTKTSEIEAPNTIDTPLGMTSGYVRSSILRTAVRESTQLILLLTHAEVLGCEEIIDQYAGVVLTLTNSAHYPKMLVNNPHVEEYKVLRCDCDHREFCRLCQRYEQDASSEL